jgi:hypothetical protein
MAGGGGEGMEKEDLHIMLSQGLHRLYEEGEPAYYALLRGSTEFWGEGSFLLILFLRGSTEWWDGGGHSSSSFTQECFRGGGGFKTLGLNKAKEPWTSPLRWYP